MRRRSSTLGSIFFLLSSGAIGILAGYGCFAFGTITSQRPRKANQRKSQRHLPNPQHR